MDPLWSAAKPPARSPALPERRRALIIGAGPTGMSAAVHLGEHSLLLERRHTLEHHHDYSNDLTMGLTHGSAMGDEDPGPNGSGFAAPAKNKTLFISCSSQGRPDTVGQTLIHVERWRPPELRPQASSSGLRASPCVSTLIPLLRGELRLNAWVTRIVPTAHLVELADGHRYVYDKLLSTLSLCETELLLRHDLPAYVRCDDSLRFWLSDHDIELADRATLDSCGDLDELAMGKRFAGQIGRALEAKFLKSGPARTRSTRLFQPRLVMP